MRTASWPASRSTSSPPGGWADSRRPSPADAIYWEQMPQPLEFKLAVTRPGPAVGVWDAFASTVGRLIVPAAGQTTLEKPDEDISNSERHVAFTEECSGDPLENERMLTPQFSAAGWADIRPEVRKVYAGVKDEIVASGFVATVPLKPKPLNIAQAIFRYQPR